MKKMSSKIMKGLVHLSFLITLSLILPACGSSNKGEATVEEVKSALPEELKDTTVLQEEEKSALDKLNSVTDSSSKN